MATVPERRTLHDGRTSNPSADTGRSGATFTDSAPADCVGVDEHAARPAEQSPSSLRLPPRPASHPQRPGGDADWVEAALGGDEHAFREIVGRHQAAVARLLRRYADDARSLEDLVQETFVEVYFALGGWRGDGLLIRWIETIAVRVGYRHLRRKYRDRRLRNAALAIARVSTPGPRQSPLQGSDAEAVAESRDEAQWLHALIGRLLPRDRLVLTLLHLEERSVREIAGMTGWSESMVKVQAHRARKRLRQLAEEAGWSSTTT